MKIKFLKYVNPRQIVGQKLKKLVHWYKKWSSLGWDSKNFACQQPFENVRHCKAGAHGYI